MVQAAAGGRPFLIVMTPHPMSEALATCTFGDVALVPVVRSRGLDHFASPAMLTLRCSFTTQRPR